jgi:large subunit ribosomal protein L31e
MAETKSPKLEREYTIPLRKAWIKVPFYERTGKAIKEIKIFLAKHMKVEDRDVKKVKIDIYSNNELWYKGRANPPSKVTVKAVKENGIVKVELAELPAHVKFLKAKHAKVHVKPVEKKEVKEEKKEETPAEKEAESEKEKSVAEAGLKEAKAQHKADKHITKSEKVEHPHRMALQK